MHLFKSIKLRLFIGILTWGVISGYGGDNNIQWNQLYHNDASAYNPTTEFVPFETFTFRDVDVSGKVYPTTLVNIYILVDWGDLTSANVVYSTGGSDLYASMSWIKNITASFHGQPSRTYDLWKGTIPACPAGTTVWYRIQVNDGSASAYLKAGNSFGGAYRNPLGQWVRNPDASASDNYFYNVENPISIAMKTLTVQPTSSGMVIEWCTDSENGVAGYHVKRAIEKVGPYVSINKDIILSQGTPSSGACYRFHDPDRTSGKIWYQIEEILLDGSSVQSEPLSACFSSCPASESIVPSDHILLRNYPNPFNSNTTIRFDLQQTETVQMTIYDLHGRLICTLVDDILPRGTHQTVWGGSDRQGHLVSSGVFLCQLDVGESRTIHRMILLK